MIHLIMLMALAQFGEQIHPGDQTTPNLHRYQHFVPAHQEDCSTNLIGCTRDVPDEWVDDVHWVTEKEWQHLGDTVKAEEEMIRILAGQIRELQHDLQTMPVTK